MDHQYPESRTHFRARLRALRKQRGLTQEALAARAGMNLQYYQGIEGGRTKNPGLITLLSLVDALEVNVGDLLELNTHERQRSEHISRASSDVF